MGEYNHTKSIDLLAETLKRNREQVRKAKEEALEAKALAAKQARRARLMVKYGRPAITIAWRLLILAGQAACWILAPIVALAFAQWFTSGMDLDHGHGALAVLATYIVAGIAGIKGAAQASRQIGEFKTINII